MVNILKIILCVIPLIAEVHSSCDDIQSLLPRKSSKKHVLVIGNSFSRQNNMCRQMEKIAKSIDSDIDCHTRAINSFTLGNHLRSEKTMNKVRSRLWDVIILQEQSVFLSQSPNNSLYSQSIVAMREWNKILPLFSNSCVLFQTWGYERGDFFRGSDDTFYKMQARLVEGYKRALQELKSIDARISPVGQAWGSIYEKEHNILFTDDGKHPRGEGTFLAACVHIRTIFGGKIKTKYRPGSVSRSEQKRLLAACNNYN